MNRKSLYSLFCLSALTLIAVCSVQASTITINLTNGNKIEVGSCWEENGSFYFSWGGGQVGIPKSSIANIKETVAEENFKDAMESPEMAACLKEAERRPYMTNLISKRYSWGSKKILIAKDPDGTKIEFSGKLITTPEMGDSLDTFRLIYTNQDGEIISERTIRPEQLKRIRATSEVHEYQLIDTLPVTACPADVEVYVTRFE